MTHAYLTNPYLRSLLAYEFMGYREVRRRIAGSGRTYDIAPQLSAAESMLIRVQLHMQRYPVEIMTGDTRPLNKYSGFAGHA